MDKASKVLKSLEKLSGRQALPIGTIKGKIIARAIRKYKPKKILEVGTLFGYSAILMARLLPRNGKLVTIEIDENYANIARKNIDDAGLSKKIKLIWGNALRVLPKIKGKFDLLFIDGKKDQYLIYLKMAEKNLKKGSVVMADDVVIFEQYMQDYLDYVRNSGEYKSKTTKTPFKFSRYSEDAIEISTKL